MRKHIVPIVIGLVASGLLATVMVPNALIARNRSRQKRTMADMRTIATAWETYATDKNFYDADSFHGPNHVTDPTHFEALHRVHYADLQRTLVPTYVKTLPKKDGWGYEFELRTGDYNAAGHAQVYAIRSPGNDGRVQSGQYVQGTTLTFADDIVLSDGSFIRFPEGT